MEYIEELLRYYENKNLVGISGTEYKFSGISFKKYELGTKYPAINGIYYLGKIDTQNSVVDYFELQFTDELFEKFDLLKRTIFDNIDNDIYHFFVYEGNDNSVSLKEVCSDLKRAIYTKKLQLP